MYKASLGSTPLGVVKIPDMGRTVYYIGYKTVYVPIDPYNYTMGGAICKDIVYTYSATL